VVAGHFTCSESRTYRSGIFFLIRTFLVIALSMRFLKYQTGSIDIVVRKLWEARSHVPLVSQQDSSCPACILAGQLQIYTLRVRLDLRNFISFSAFLSDAFPVADDLRINRGLGCTVDLACGVGVSNEGSICE
jgi:hypothetical protein